MKLLFFLLASFSLLQNVSSQSLLKDTAAKPYVMVDTFSTCINCLIINQDEIKSIDIFKGDNATNLYGEKAKEGAIVINMKEPVKLSRLKDIFDAFNFPDSNRNLRVCINEMIVSNPELILADLDEVESIGTFISLDYSTDANCSVNMKEEKLINITSRKR